MSSTLITASGYKIEKFPDDPHKILNKITIAYGETESGKTVILKYLLKIIRKYVPVPLIVSKEELSNKSYRGHVPDCCIRTTLTLKWLESLQQRQSETMETYQFVNNIDSLKDLAYKVIDTNHKNQEAKIKRIAKREKITLKRKFRTGKIDKNNMKAQRDDITDKRNEFLKWLYKSIIKDNFDKLTKCKLNKTQKMILKFINLNPNVICMIDDFAASLKTWGSKEVLKNLFYVGRHKHLSTFITCQNDKSLGPDLRENSHLAIFTQRGSAQGYFNVGTNNFSKSDKKKAEEIIERVFTVEPGESASMKNRKLVYERKTRKYYWILGDPHIKFKLGGKAIWDINEQLPKIGKSVDKNNRFIRYVD
jgi:hypothetical protein